MVLVGVDAQVGGDLERALDDVLRRHLGGLEEGARDIVKKSLEIAGEICIYTNMNHTIEVLE